MFDRSQREHTVLGIIKPMQPLVRTRFKLDVCAGGTCRSPRAYEGNKYFTYSHTHDNRDSNFGGRDRETGHATWPFVLSSQWRVGNVAIAFWVCVLCIAPAGFCCLVGVILLLVVVCVLLLSSARSTTGVGNLRHACQVWYGERFSMARRVN